MKKEERKKEIEKSKEIKEEVEDTEEIKEETKINITKVMNVTLPAAAVLIAYGVIWGHLLRISRQDIFMETVSFRDVFSLTGVAFIISTLLFCVVYYTPSFYAALVIKREVNNYADYQKIKKKYILILFISTYLASFLLLLAALFFPVNTFNQWEMTGLMLAVGPVCIGLSLLLNSKVVRQRTRYMDGKDSFFFNLRMHMGTPFILGILSWVYVFPLSLMMHNLTFLPGTDDRSQWLDTLMLTSIVLFTSLLPGVVYITASRKSSLLKQAVCVGGTAIGLLMALSTFLPVIPALLINYTVKMTGIIDTQPYDYVVSTTAYPREAFSSPEWHYQKTADGNFHRFDGVTLFSFGTVQLVCPPNVIPAYRESLKYVFASPQYDEQKRDALADVTGQCLVFKKEQLIKMGKL